MRITAARRTAARAEDGQALVEFALVAPLVLMLLFGIIQFGIAFNNSIALTDAVRAGSRAAVVAGPNGADGAARQAVLAAGGSLDTTQLSTGITVKVNGSDVTVTAVYPYSIDLLGVVVKSGLLSSSTTERFE
jgi:Flp pilus assembly protein TadG